MRAVGQLPGSRHIIMNKKITIPEKPQTFLEKISLVIPNSVGTTTSLVLHSIFFVGIFSLRFFNVAYADILLILTTVVSLEAIYLSLFIQMTVNRNTESLKIVEEDIDDIQEDVEDIEEDFGDIQEDVEGLESNFIRVHKNVDDIQEDVEDISEDIDKMQLADTTAQSVGSSGANGDSLALISKHLEQITKDMNMLKKEISSLKK